MPSRVSWLCALGSVAGLLVTPARGAAQGLQPAFSQGALNSQYLGSGTTTVAVVPEREGLFEEARQSRFRLGPLRLHPVLYIGNLGYTNNFFGETEQEKEGSFTATAGGGVKGYLPVGNRVMLRGSVLPAYTWYSAEPDRGGLQGTYDFSGYFYVGRFGLSVTAGSYKAIVDLSSEVPQPVTQTVLLGSFVGDYSLSSRMSAVGTLRVSRRTYGDPGLTPADQEKVAGLDGTDLSWSLGLRRRLGSRLTIGLSYESGEFASVSQGALRDSTNWGVLGSAYLDRGKLRANVYFGYRSYEASGGSSFTATDGPSGGINLQYDVGRRVFVGVEGVNSLLPSLYETNASYVERRLGPTLGLDLGRFRVTARYSLGSNDYLVAQEIAPGETIKRKDDTQATYLTGSLMLVKWMTIDASLSWTDYRSNIPGYDRSVFAVTTNLRVGASGIQILK